MPFNISFSETSVTLDVQMSKETGEMKADFAGYQQVNISDPYTGSYEITPKVEAQTIPTAQKFMTSDMRIKEIPIYDVGNTSGGRTIYIAKEM